MFIPVKLAIAFFFAGLPLAFYKGLREPIWFAAAACYLYFAIPSLEFHAPEAPYQAAFWALAALTSVRYVAMLRDRARQDLDRVSITAVREAIEGVRTRVKNALVMIGLAAPRPGMRDAVMIACEPHAFDIVDKTAPLELSLPIRRAVQNTLRAAADAGERECLSLTKNLGAGTTRGNLKSALEERIPAVVDATLDVKLEANTLQQTERAVANAERDHTRAIPPGTGALGVPLPRGPLTALLSNPGLWILVAFTILTYVGALHAKYDVIKAMTRFDMCVLLFIPAIGIICAVREPRHVKIFVGAWIVGTLHLSINAVTWWFQYGGRADSPGGQGGESNYLAAIIATICPVSFGMIVNSKKWRDRAIWTGVAAMFTLGVLASGSRAGLIALVGCGGYWLFHTNRKGIAAGGALIAFACFLGVAPEEFWGRMATMLVPKDRNPWIKNAVEPSAHERQVLWALAIDVFKDNPWMGIGPRQYVFESAEHTDFTDPYQQQRGLQTHNTWLQLAAEYGVLGCLVWGGGFFFSMACYVMARRRMKKYPGWEWFGAICLGLEAGAIGNFIICTFNSFQWYDYQFWHLIFGPLVLQVARDTAERLDWLAPKGERAQPRPPPRYGPPVAQGLDLGNIDLSHAAPLPVASEAR